MLVSTKWLSRNVDLVLQHDELVDRLSLSGLNHESSETVNGDVVIDLEVTSNRGDCLGHIGVAREIAVLTGQTLRIDPAKIETSKTPLSSVLSIDPPATDACPRYTARVVTGVKIGPSPAWMVDALNSIGIASINNVVDVTNYVMMECGQPLHAFDLAKLRGGKISIRNANPGENFVAIDHRNYALQPSDCVIADAQGAVAIAGVMGGENSEVDDTTVDVVVESAIFLPMSVRRTARRLKLHSPSSFRFERRVDPIGVDWASRRACQLIVETAGGEVLDGVIDTDPNIADGTIVALRASRISQVLGIDIPAADVDRILTGLGCAVTRTKTGERWDVVSPSWRHDLTREVDLIEEVARIYGYDKIPENASIPVAPSGKRDFDVATSRIRSVLTAAGFSEAMTPSVVTEKLDQSMSPWTDRPALQTRTAMLVGSKVLRRSLLPSLLASRAANHASASVQANLFEIAHVYLPPDPKDDIALPTETYHLGIIGGDDFFAMKGTIETLLIRLGITSGLSVTPIDDGGFGKGGLVKLTIVGNPEPIGYLGLVSPALVKQSKLPAGAVAAELSIDALMQRAHLVPQQRRVSPFPSIHRDLNLVLPEPVRWIELSSIIEEVAGPRLAGLAYQETYRNEKQDGPSKKRVLFSMELQSQTETLAGTDADAIVEKLVGRCETELGAILMR